MNRLGAGLQLGALVGFWLVAWLPLALYCLLTIAVGGLRGPGRILS